MEIKSFKYHDSVREVVVFKETSKNGKEFIEGVDISSLPDQTFAAKLREDAPHLIIKMNETSKKDYIADSRKVAEEGKDVAADFDVYPDFQEMIVAYRMFDKSKIKE